MSDDLPESESRLCLKSIIEHWAEARIDGPMEAIARYDEAAKQLITIGGFLQGGLVAVYSVLGRQHPITMNGWQKTGIVVFGVCLLAFLILAAWSCSLQPEMESRRISSLLKKALQHCVNETDLSGEVEHWCRDVENKMQNKRKLMLCAKGFFILCSGMMMLLLFSLVLPNNVG